MNKGLGIFNGPYIESYKLTPMELFKKYNIMNLDSEALLLIKSGLEKELNEINERISRISTRNVISVTSQEEMKLSVKSKEQIKSVLMMIDKEIEDNVEQR